MKAHDLRRPDRWQPAAKGYRGDSYGQFPSAARCPSHSIGSDGAKVATYYSTHSRTLPPPSPVEVYTVGFSKSAPLCAN